MRFSLNLFELLNHNCKSNFSSNLKYLQHINKLHKNFKKKLMTFGLNIEL